LRQKKVVFLPSTEARLLSTTPVASKAYYAHPHHHLPTPPTMAILASRSRKRYLVVGFILTLLVIIYVTTAPSATRDSEFYRKTVALMSQKANSATSNTDTKLPFPNNADGSGSTLSEAERKEKEALLSKDALKDRLQNAATAAKKSADDKWQEMKDLDVVKNAVAEAKAVEAKAKAAAAEVEAKAQAAAAEVTKAAATANKKFPIEEGAKQSTIDTKEDGVAHVGPHADATADTAASTPAEDQADKPKEELKRLLRQGPIIIFSKSYCPYSKKAKSILLEQMSIVPTPVVVELDQHEMGPDLQDLLGSMTGRRTVPNVLVNSKPLGGGDDVERMLNDGTLEDKIKELGGARVEQVVRKKAPVVQRSVGRDVRI